MQRLSSCPRVRYSNSKDGLIKDMTRETLQLVCSAKVAGHWNWPRDFVRPGISTEKLGIVSRVFFPQGGIMEKPAFGWCLGRGLYCTTLYHNPWTRNPSWPVGPGMTETLTRWKHNWFTWCKLTSQKWWFHGIDPNLDPSKFQKRTSWRSDGHWRTNECVCWFGCFENRDTGWVHGFTTCSKRIWNIPDFGPFSCKNIECCWFCPHFG